MPSKNIADFAYQVRDYMRSAEVVEGKNIAYSQENNAVIATIENGKSYKVRWTGSATVTLKKNSASGTEVTSGSTSPLSFTADSDFDLYFGSSADVTEIMVYDGNDTDDTYVAYYVPVKDSKLSIKDQQVLGAWNEFKITAETTTVGETVFTINNDGSVTIVSPANHAQAFLDLNIDYLPNHSFYLSGCPSGGGSSTYELQLNNYNGSVFSNYGGDTYVDKTQIVSNTKYRYRVLVRASADPVNVTFYPMIAPEPNQPYVSGAMTNRELTDKFTPVKLTSSNNLDDCTDTGYYYYETDLPVNAPDTANTKWAKVIVMGSEWGSVPMQIVISPVRVYTRRYGGSPISWGTWYKFEGTQL